MRFEIACYRNKIMDFRQGLEKDLEEVLQTDRIFTNVSKGRFAPTSDLQKAFGTTDQEAIARKILQEGQSLQVSDLERAQLHESTMAQIATWVAHNCVHSQTTRPFTVSQIQQALGTHFQVQPHKALKKQYLDAVHFLKTVLPIQRAPMDLLIQYSVDQQSVVDDELGNIQYEVVGDTTTGTHRSMTLRVDPSLYRELNSLTQKVDGKLEVVQQVVMEVTGDIDLETDLLQRQEAATAAAAAAAVTQEVEQEMGQLQISDEPLSKSQKRKNKKAQRQKKQQQQDDSDEEVLIPLRSDSDDDGTLEQTSRNQQKNQKKKNKKQLRREQQRQQQQDDNEQPDEEPSPVSPKNEVPAPLPVTGKRCNTCGGNFGDHESYRSHFRSDWHRFNQKLKLKGIVPVSEEEFKLCDADAFFGSPED